VLAIAVQMQIFIKTLDGKKFPLIVKSSDQIINVMEKILDKEDIPVNDQRLLFGCKRLDGGLTLANYNIQDNSTLILMLHIIGD